MRLEEVQGTKDLCAYIKLELVRQTQEKRTLRLELPEPLFFKMMKLIMFVLKDKEENARKEVDRSCKKFLVKINGTFTVVTRKNEI